MWGDFYRESEALGLPLVALFLFLGVFVAIVVRTVNSGAAAHEEAARLPLDGGEHHG